MSTSLKFRETDSGNEEQTVIQCPCCSTRFSVESSMIAAVASPKFHCSRCDNIFGLDEIKADHSPAARPELNQKAKEVFEHSLRPVLGRSPRHSEGYSTTPSAQESLPGFSEQSGDLTEGVVAVYRNKARIQKLPPRISDNGGGSVNKQLEIPRRWEDGMRPSAEPRETIPEQSALAMPERQLGGQIGFQPPRLSPLSAVAGDSIDINSFGTVKNAPLADTPGSMDSTRLGSDGSVAYKADNPALVAALNQPASTAARGTLTKLSAPRSFWKMLVAPSLGFLAIMGITSIALFNSSSLSQHITKAFVPGALEAAPSELYIKNSKFEKVTLDNGEIIRVVSGVIVNSSERSFRAIEIEAALFDGTGKAIGTYRANAANTLAKTKINSLTPEMIDNLQAASTPKRLVLRPSENKEFAIALRGDQFARAQHFGARIYSAKSL
jgi:predicted Zn finger-like uncharacterized protein